MQVNRRNVVSWLVFDLDHDNPMIWEDAALPPPNLIVRNRRSSSAHLFYAISPILTGPGARQKPIDYMRAVYTAMAKKLRADLAYSGPVAKTPGHQWWQTSEIHNEEYSLADLDPWLTLEYQPPWRVAPDLETVSHSRHCTLFEIVRHFAYSIVREERARGSEASFVQRVTEYAKSKNCFVGKYFKARKLRESQVRATVKSITRWTWSKYYGAADCARGTMLLDPSIPLPTKQRLAAKHTHKVRKTKTVEKIQGAVANLSAQGLALSQTVVAQAAGISRQTVAKHKSLLTPPKPKIVDFVTEKQRLASKRDAVKNAVYQITALCGAALFNCGVPLAPGRKVGQECRAPHISEITEFSPPDTS
jgi:hypothetical protein